MNLMMAQDGHGMLYAPLLGYTERNLDGMREMLVHPSTVLGLADGGAHVGVICDGSMPTFMLTLGCATGAEAERIPLETAVQLQTERTAQLFGVRPIAGRLAAGYLADVNVIDFDHLSLGPVRMAHDLPAGGRRLVQHASWLPGDGPSPASWCARTMSPRESGPVVSCAVHNSDEQLSPR